MSQCKYYISKNGRCRIGEFEGKPSEEDCGICEKYEGPSRGLGDKVEKVLKVTGIQKAVKTISRRKGCGCGKRRKALNDAFPSKENSDA
tara:strand:- start:686 stop:952 length:267 start_codon:yes stop_codon:yes gene_type:complete